MRRFLFLLFIFLLFAQPVEAAPDKKTVNTAIEKAQKYYEGLYVDLGDKGAVIKEFYTTSPKSKYTVRHGVIGGVYYYAYIGDTEKAAKLLKFAQDHGFNVDDDLHSFIWKQQADKTVDLYSDAPYKDCFVDLPEVKNVMPHKSKVCKLGDAGRFVYREISKRDTLVPQIEQLQNLATGKKVDDKLVKELEKKFDEVGGIPMCVMNNCQDTASAIRTATFGELQLRLGNMEYADKAAEALLRAQDKNGAIYHSFDKNGKLRTDKTWIYQMINKILAENPIFKGYIPTNAESMNDILAFLAHWRCAKFGICR